MVPVTAELEGSPSGFLPRRARSELPATESLRSPNLSHSFFPRSPRTSLYAVGSAVSSPMTSPGAVATHQISTSNAVVYPQDGPSELEVPLPGPRFSNVDPSASRAAPMAGNSWAQEDMDTSKETVASVTTGSGSNTIVPQTDEEAAIALEQANLLLRFASQRIDSSPSAARKAYADALTQYRHLDFSDPSLCVRKFRSMVNAELGLSLVAADQQKHIDRAQTHCATALRYARGSLNRGDVYGAMLDAAKVKARYARLQEKAGTGHSDVVAIQGDAFDLFLEIRRNLTGNCATPEDFNTLAQALLGAARMANFIQKVASPGSSRTVSPPDVYLKDALEQIAEAHRIGVPPSPAADRLIETREAIIGLMRKL